MDLDIYTIRKDMGYTQQELADYLGVSRATIINYEKGGKIPARLKPRLINFSNILDNGSAEFNKSKISVPFINVGKSSHYIRYYTDKAFIKKNFSEITYLFESRLIDIAKTYISFELKDGSMDGGGINDTPEGAELFCEEVNRTTWLNGFDESKYGYVIVHKDTILHKDIKDYNVDTNSITCSSRSSLPQFNDFSIKIDDIMEIWKVLKRSF